MRFLLFFLICTISALGQNNVDLCQAGQSNGYDCSNIHLMSFVDVLDLNDNTFAELNDIWGWTDANSNREFALVGMTTGTAFVEVTDPVNPVILGKLPTHTSNSLWRDMKVCQDHVFIGSEANNHGMQVFDLTQLLTADPNSYTIFTSTAHYSGFGDSHNIVINEGSGFAFGVGANNFSGGLHAVNIQTPTSPVIAGGFSDDGYTHDAQVVNYIGPDTDYSGKEIAFCFNADALTIVDVSDKTDMTQISSTTYVGEGYTHQGWVTEDHKYLLMDDELDELNFGVNTTTFIWDIQDLDNPFVLGTYVANQAAIDHNLYIKGNLAFLANYRAGLRVLDITDIANANLTEVGYYDTYLANDNTGFNGLWSNYPYFESQNVILSDIEQGLFVVRPVITDITELGQTCPSLDVQFDLSVRFGLNGPINISAINLPGGVIANFSINDISLNESSTLTLSNTGILSAGQYTIDIIFSDGLVDHQESITFTALSSSACDDGNPCTINDIEILAEDGSVCVPCAGEINESSCESGCTTVVPCDDGNPCTSDDVETTAADGSICIPCAGIIDESSCNQGCTSSVPCDDGNPCTVGDVTIIALDGSVCVPCSGTLIQGSCDPGCTIDVPCDDGNPCTINDTESVAADGTVCTPCAGLLDETSCDSGCTNTAPCDDGNSCTINDVVTLAADGTICIPCSGTVNPSSCETGCTTIESCDDGNPSTENDVQTIALDGTICIPCGGTPISDSDGDGIPDASDNCPTVFNPNQNLFTFYFDSDGDGFGDPLISTTACEPSAVFVSNSDDCDDTNPNINPDAIEDCGNGLDDDCDGVVDSGCEDCIAENFVNAPDGLFEVQTSTTTRLKWNHYSDATSGCLISTQQVDEFGNNVGAPINFPITGPAKLSPDVNGHNKSDQYGPDHEFIKFNSNTYPNGNAASWTPGAEYKWRVRCACLINPGLPLPDRVKNFNLHLSPWSEWDFFTNLSSPPSNNSSSNHSLEFSTVSSITLSPNPTQGLTLVEIESNKSQQANVVVYDITSRNLMSETWNLIKGVNQFEIDLSENSPGLYLIRLQLDNELITSQILKN